MSTSNLYEDLYNFLNFSSTDLDLSMSAGQTCYGSVFTVERNASNVVDKAKKKIYPCEFCNKSFTKPSALRSHTYTHTGEKPFACHYRGCTKRFAVASNLRRHFKVHTRKTEPTIKFQYPVEWSTPPPRYPDEEQSLQQTDAFSLTGEPVSAEDFSASGFESLTTLSDSGSIIDASSIILTPSPSEQVPLMPWQVPRVYHALQPEVSFLQEGAFCSSFLNMPIMSPFDAAESMDRFPF